MRACSTASGGVFFVPEELDRKKVKPTKYSEFVEEQKETKKLGLFGKKKTAAKAAKKGVKAA